MSELCLDCGQPIEQLGVGRRRKWCTTCRPRSHKPPKPKVEREDRPCAECGTLTPRQYCSQRCLDLSKRVPCAGSCGGLIHLGRGSLPPGQARCRACRKTEKRSRQCQLCGCAIDAASSGRRYCSRACSNAGRRTGRRTQARACEVCGDVYVATHSDQRTCGRVCGWTLRGIGTPGKTCSVYFPACTECGETFTARSSRQKRCSAQCRIDASGHRVKDLYALIVAHRGRGEAGGWRKDLVQLLKDRDGDHCGICLMSIDFTLSSGPKGDDRGASIDHIHPRSLGGGDELANLRLTHWACNRKRRNKVDEDALFAV